MTMTTINRVVNSTDDLWKDKKYVQRYNELYPLPVADCEVHAELLNINGSDHLVDFGCGAGAFIRFAHEERKCQSVTGIDLSFEQLSLSTPETKNGENNFTLIQSSFLDVELPTNHFTKGFARASLHHLNFEEKKFFFSRIKKSFTANSSFLLCDMAYDFPKGELMDLLPQLQQEASAYYGEAWEKKKNDIMDTWMKEFPEDINGWCEAFHLGGFSLVKQIRMSSFISMLLFTRA